MFNLKITFVRYPKNETYNWEFSSLNGLLDFIKKLVIEKKINIKDIIKIEEVER